EDCSDLRLDTLANFVVNRFIEVLVSMSGKVRGPGEKHLDDTPTIGEGQLIHSISFLLPAHGSFADPKGDEGLVCWIVEKDIYLVAAKPLCHQMRSLVERCVNLGGGQFQQSFECG